MLVAHTMFDNLGGGGGGGGGGRGDWEITWTLKCNSKIVLQNIFWLNHIVVHAYGTYKIWDSF